MTQDEIDEIVNTMRKLQREPGTIIIGFSPRTTFPLEFRQKYLQDMRSGNPGRPILEIDYAPLDDDEIMVCEPDDADEPLAFFRLGR